MPSQALQRFRKSTIVRSFAGSSLLFLLKTSTRLMPQITVRWAEWRFRTPPRQAPWSEESDWLKDAAVETVTFEEHRLHAWTLGSGPAVLLVHGWGGRGSQLGALALALVEQGFRVVGFDAPGHGRSNGRRSSLVEMAEAIEEMARRAGDLYAVIAHSAGAAATTYALHQTGLKPGRLIYIAPGVDPAGFIEYFTRALDLPAKFGRQIQQRVEKRFGVTFKDLSSLELAPRMSVPLHILHDPEDREVPWEGARRLAQRWPGASLVSLRGVGHYRILRAPETLAEVIAFLADASSSTARIRRRHRGAA